MSMQKVTFRPGINAQFTPTLNEGGWELGNLVRFKDGLPQPIGGWQASLRNVLFGSARGIHSWSALDSTKMLAVGTSSGLYLSTTTQLYEITPSRATFSPTNPFAVTLNSNVVTMTVTGHGAVVGDLFLATPSGGSVTVGGITITNSFVYQVASVIDANTITFTVSMNATSTSTGGGSVTVLFMISPAAANGIWSLDNWGEELVGCIRNGKIYNWKPSGGYGTRAAVVSSNAPAQAACILTAMPERHLVAYGATNSATGVQDPMLIAWSDTEDYTTWTASATNAAGTFRLVGGSQIMAALAAPQEILVWTDTTLWAQRFEGLPYVYGFFQQGEACGLIGPNAAKVMNGAAYWMGRQGFFQYAGTVQPLRCTVWDDVFRNLNENQLSKIYCGTNLGFNEITWFYPSLNSTEVDSYVTFQTLDGIWTTGLLSRTAWEDTKTFHYPIGIGSDGMIYYHEIGTSYPGAGNSFIQSGYFDIADGEDFVFLDKIIPDFADISGTLTITVYGQSFPNGGVKTKGPYTITSTTPYITVRMRARQILLRIDSTSTNAFWRLGAIRTLTAPDGRKG